MAASISTALKEQLSCSVCLDVYTQPKTLKCLHTFCLPCLKELADKTPPEIPLRCPDCKADIHLPPGASVDDLPNAFYFKRLLELLAIQEPEQTTANCGSCNRNLPLTSFCFDCRQFLCGECVNAHKLFQLLKTHRLASLRELRNESDARELLERPDNCGIEYHDEERLEYFCEDCETSICQKCALIEHKLHYYVPIRQATDHCKAAMIQAVNEVKKKFHVVEGAIQKAEESFGTTLEQIETVSHDVEERIQNFIRLLKEHKESVTSELEHIQQRETRRYEAERTELEVQLAQLKSAMEFVDAAVERNLSREIINTHDTVIKRCTELVSNVEQVNFQTSKVEVQYEAFKEFVVTTAELTPGRLLVTGLVDPWLSTVEDEEMKEVTLGEQTEFTVVTRDSQGQICSYGGDCVEVTITSSTGEAVESTVLDQKNGHYTVRYTPRNAGSCEVAVQILGRAVAGSPFEVRIRQKEFKPLKTFGSKESRTGRLYSPWGIAVNSKGEVAVTDVHRIQLFTSDGKHLRTIGSRGSGKGKFNMPTGIAFDTQGQMIVADCYNNRVQVLTTAGEYVNTIGEGKLQWPGGVCVTSEGNIAVCSAGEKRGVKVFGQDGMLVRWFDDPKRKSTPHAVTISEGKFFVSYADDHVVSVFSREGTLLHSFGGRGQLDGQFNLPWGVAVGQRGQVFVCDSGNHRIQVFTAEGQFLGKRGKQGTALLQFSEPLCITVSASGQVYVSEFQGQRVQTLLYQ